VSSNNALATVESQSKSVVILYVGIGNVSGTLFAPSDMAEINAKLINSLSSAKSANVSVCGSPPITTGSVDIYSGHTTSKLRFVKGD
jgi:hypothetical protein